MPTPNGRSARRERARAIDPTLRVADPPTPCSDVSGERSVSEAPPSYEQPELPMLDDPTPVPPAVISRREAEIGAARARIEGTPRDEFGFPTGPAVSLTREQFQWLSWRLDSNTDEEADDAANTSEIRRKRWQLDPAFAALYETCMENKREATRLLGTQLLPKALRTIHDMLDSENTRAKQVGLTMLLKMQGLLIESRSTSTPNELLTILSALRESRPPEFLALPPTATGLMSGSDRPNMGVNAGVNTGLGGDDSEGPSRWDISDSVADVIGGDDSVCERSEPLAAPTRPAPSADHRRELG